MGTAIGHVHGSGGGARPRRDSGFSILETVVVMSLGSVMMMIAVFDLRGLDNASLTGAATLGGFIKTVRAKALSSTMAYTVRRKADSDTAVETSRGFTCAGAQTPDSSMTFALGGGARMTGPGWSVCYSPRGFADTSADVVVLDNRGARTVQIAIGGGVRVR